jgi:hypothetical protein
MPDWIRFLVVFAVVFIAVAALKRRRRGIMHDRDALAKKFNTKPEDIVEVKRSATD